tara:strand:+ start:132211 stop:132348 length:138 start_codon:yes stop_codon:yes gene_type:complete
VIGSGWAWCIKAGPVKPLKGSIRFAMGMTGWISSRGLMARPWATR